ncbi:hypothetical protein MrNuV_ORF068 [Macrobrachium rosenbergii nudivirus]|nr:hypothetical protein MrNuV_ORF068 [Macrobrachium rosenbergii nudivirus]
MGICVRYIVSELSKDNTIKKYLNESQIKKLKKDAITILPPKISSSDEIKIFIINYIEKIIQENTLLLYSIISAFKDSIVDKLCNKVDSIIMNKKAINRLKVNSVKTKRLQHKPTPTNKN